MNIEEKIDEILNEKYNIKDIINNIDSDKNWKGNLIGILTRQIENMIIDFIKEDKNWSVLPDLIGYPTIGKIVNSSIKNIDKQRLVKNVKINLK